MAGTFIVPKRRGNRPSNAGRPHARSAAGGGKPVVRRGRGYRGCRGGRGWVIAFTAGLAAGVPCALASANPLPDFRTVALTGEQVPGAEPGVVFNNFSPGAPVLNSAGQTAFGANVSGASVDGSNFRGIYSEGGGTLAQVARTGQQAPDADPGVLFSLFSSPVFNGAGQTAFFADLTGAGVDGTNDGGIYSEGGGTLAQVARAGQQAPDADPGVLFRGLSAPILNGAGETAFFSGLTGTGVVAGTNAGGIYREGGGTLAQVVRAGQQAPDASPGVVFSLFGPGDRVFNDAGQTVFSANLTGPGVDFRNDSGIYRADGGTLAQVARKGQQAPDAGPGVIFSDLSFTRPVLNNAGQIAFFGSLIGPGVGPSNDNDTGIYRSEADGTLALIAREGQQAPDADPGVLFSSLGFPVINGAGQTAFSVFLIGPGVDFTNDTGIYREAGGTLAQVARIGQQAPDAGPGVVFSSLSSIPALNGAGQTAFFARLTGAGVDFSNDSGIYATDLNGQLVQIVRTGDLFDVNDDPLIEDLRTISSLSLAIRSGNEDGRPSSFNDLGQLAFRANFTDATSGVFVSNLVAVPEPASAAWLLGGGTLLAAGARRRRP